ncbi:MAG: cytidylate kinase-like family protein [Alistipes sp.]|nr:cytidylate kinase-like family protein [Alistipes sp.]
MENRFVINIGRQLGSGGREVGEVLARRLGIELYDKKLINLAAQQSGLCPEVFERADEKESHNRLATLLSYLRAHFAGDGGATTDVLSGDALFKIQSDVIREVAARESALFVGRCADYILREHPRMVSVFITADDADRIRRICARTGCSEAEARQIMARGDARRADYYNYFSLRTWGAAASYDLCVSTSALGVESAADLILRFAARKLDLKMDL